MPIRVLIVNEHKVMCAGLVQLINADLDLVVGTSTPDGKAVLCALEESMFDVLFLDMILPSPSSFELVRKVREQHPALPILVLIFQDDIQLAQAAIRAGAGGFITKSTDPACLLRAIREVSRGNHYMEPSLMQEIVFLQQPVLENSLTLREKEVLDYLVSGMSNREIAAFLGLSEKTISSHRVRLSRKLGARSLKDLMKHSKSLP